MFYFNNVNAQILQIGLKAGLNKTELSNNNIALTEPPEGPSNYKMSHGSNWGVSLGFYIPRGNHNFLVDYGIQAELLKNSHNQNFTRIITQKNVSNEYEFNVNLNSIDVPVLFRMNTYYGVYIETGVQFSTLYFANETSENISLQRNFSDKNTFSNYSQNNTMAIGGLGMNLCMTNELAINIGFRASYGINDITFPQSIKFDNYIPTHSIAYGVTIELAYRLPFSKNAQNQNLRHLDYHNNSMGFR